MTKPQMISRDIARVALVLAILPTAVININYLIAASEGYVPWCVPYWDSCTSISATGQEGRAFFFFKSTMIPIAFIYLWYWKLADQALAETDHSPRTIANIGIIACVALICYTGALGAVGDSFRLVRRIGIIVFFTFTYLNQLLVLYQIHRRKLADPSRQMQFALCLLILAIGVLTLSLEISLDNYDDYEDAFEWILALLIHVNFLLAWWGWRTTTHSSASQG